MTLIPEWRVVLRRAWSFRFIALAALLSGAEAAVSFFTPIEPPWWWALVVFALTASALIARFVMQPSIRPECTDANEFADTQHGAL